MQANKFKRSLIALAVVGAFGVGAVTAERAGDVQAGDRGRVSPRSSPWRPPRPARRCPISPTSSRSTAPRSSRSA